MPRVLVVGHVTHDRYGDAIVPGGCAFYGAQVYHQLGAQTHLVTAVGDDFQCGEALVAPPATVTRGGRTTLFTNYYPRDRPRVQLLEASAPEVTPDGVADPLLASDLVHLAPVLGEVAIERWKRAARSPMLCISVQGWIKTAGPRADEPAAARLLDHDMPAAAGARLVVQRPWQIEVDALRGIHAACVSEEDLIGQGDLLDRLCAAIPIVAFTHGAAGCDVIVRGTTTRVGAYATQVTDATGAGDTFAAGFLYRLASGDEPVEAARFGAAAASIVVEATGGAALSRVGEAVGRARAVPVEGAPRSASSDRVR